MVAGRVPSWRGPRPVDELNGGRAANGYLASRGDWLDEDLRKAPFGIDVSADF
jgi:hypothetical protein